VQKDLGIVFKTSQDKMHDTLVAILHKELAVIKETVQELEDSPANTLLPAQQPELTMKVETPDQTAPKLLINLPDISTKTDGSVMSISFDQGLFVKGVTLTPEAEEVLNALGQQLEPYAQQVHLHVQGCTDSRTVRPGGLFTDNVALGLQRAAVVVEYLRYNGRLPAVMFTLGSVGPCDLALSGASDENNKRSRTVVLNFTKVE
jgi:outer membrane protein OmpA-like peptidoglycan-associated protein